MPTAATWAARPAAAETTGIRRPPRFAATCPRPPVHTDRRAPAAWKKVSVLGGSPVTLFPLTGGARGASWGLDDTIIFAQGVAGTGLLRGPAAGGEPGVLTTPDAEQGETNHWWPEILPGGEAVLFTIVRGEGAGDMEIAVLDLATRARTVLVPGGSNPRYALTGHIIYGADGRLWAVPFDVDRLEVTGDPVPVLENVVTKPTGAVDFGVARDGSLVYVAGDFDRLPRRTLVWVDREGREEAISTPPRGYFYPRISPDGTQVALDVRDQGSEIWIWDFVREALTRLTFDPGNDRFPVWSPDGRRIAFSSQRDGSRGNLFWQAADGTGQVELLGLDPISWTRSERWIRCPEWQQPHVGGHAGNSVTSSGLGRSGWCWKRGRRSAPSPASWILPNRPCGNGSSGRAPTAAGAVPV